MFKKFKPVNYYCRHICKESLTYLFFDHCKSTINHEYVTRLHHLYTLAFNDCGAIPSIKFINTMPSLKDIRFGGTDVIDGDMTPCIGFEYAAFTNKKHFTHTMEQVKKLSDTQS
jgi:protein phosphatase 1 regulatory subunit 7